MVLGVHWMKHVSPICFDFNKMEVTFEKKGKRMNFTSNKEMGMCKMIIGRRLQKMFRKKMTQIAQLFPIQAIEGVEEEGQELGNDLMVIVSNPPQVDWEVEQLDLLNILLVK